MGSTWVERLDRLRDRFTLRALVVAAVGLLALLLVMVHGLALLGTRSLVPTLAYLVPWVGVMVLVLFVPWEWGGVEPREPLARWWGYWEGWLVGGAVLNVARMHDDALRAVDELRTKLQLPDALSSLRIEPEQLRALRADTWGAELVGHLSGWFWVPWGACLATLAFAWWLLR